MTPVSLGNCNYIETKHSKHTEIIKDPGLSIAEFINVYRTVTLTLSLSHCLSLSLSLFLPLSLPSLFFYRNHHLKYSLFQFQFLLYNMRRQRMTSVCSIIDLKYIFVSTIIHDKHKRC